MRQDIQDRCLPPPCDTQFRSGLKLAKCLQHPIGMLGLQVGTFHVDAGNNILMQLISHQGGVPAAEFILQETFKEGVARHIQGLKHTSEACWDTHCPDVGILESLLHRLSAVSCKYIQDDPLDDLLGAHAVYI